MLDVGVLATRCLQGHIERLGNVLSLHRRTQLPGDDVARVIIEHRGEVHPAPPDDLEVGKVCLPHLVRACCLGMELISRFDHGVSWAGDQIVRLQQAVNGGFGHKVAPFIGEAHGQFSG